MTGSTPQTLSTDLPQSMDVHRLEVTHVEHDAYAVDVRGHRLQVDQPVEAGGTDTAPTPTELFAACPSGAAPLCWPWPRTARSTTPFSSHRRSTSTWSHEYDLGAGRHGPPAGVEQTDPGSG